MHDAFLICGLMSIKSSGCRGSAFHIVAFYRSWWHDGNIQTSLQLMYLSKCSITLLSDVTHFSQQLLWIRLKTRERQSCIFRCCFCISVHCYLFESILYTGGCSMVVAVVFGTVLIFCWPSLAIVLLCVKMLMAHHLGGGGGWCHCSFYPNNNKTDKSIWLYFTLSNSY